MLILIEKTFKELVLIPLTFEENVRIFESLFDTIFSMNENL